MEFVEQAEVDAQVQVRVAIHKELWRDENYREMVLAGMEVQAEEIAGAPVFMIEHALETDPLSNITFVYRRYGVEQ